MSTKKIVTSTIYYGVIPKLTIFVNVLILPIITPFLTTEDYGIQGVISSYTSMFLALAPMGLHVHLTNSFYEYPRYYNLLWGRLLFLFIVLGGIYGLFNVFTIMVVMPSMPVLKLLILAIIGSVSIFLMSNSILASHLFPIVERPKPLVLTNLLASCLGILFAFILIYYFRLGYWGLLAQTAISTLVAYIIFVKFVWYDYDIWPIVERNFRRLREMFKIAIPLIPHAFGFALLTSSARIILSVLHVSYDEIGLFSHGCVMGDYAIVVTSALSTAVVASMQRYYRNKKYRDFRKLYYLCQVVALLSSALLCIWMTEIYQFLIHNAALSKSSRVASLVCFANVVLPLYTFMSTTTFIEKQTKQILWLVFIPGIINLALCLITIPLWGYISAVYCTIVSYWSQLFIPFFIKYYRNTVNEWMGGLWKLWIVLFVMIFLLFFSNIVSEFALVYRIMTTLTLLLFFLVWYRRNKLYLLV